MSDRGEYRSIHTVLIDGPDFQALSPSARLALLTIKLSLGASGIGVLYHASLAAQTGLAAHALARALTELQLADWIRADGNLTWIVRGLEFEPTMRPNNEKHRAGIRAHLAGLPRRALLEAFRSHYAVWFVDERVNRIPSDSHADALPMPPEAGERIEDRGERIKERGRTTARGRARAHPDLVDIDVEKPRRRGRTPADRTIENAREFLAESQRRAQEVDAP